MAAPDSNVGVVAAAVGAIVGVVSMLVFRFISGSKLPSSALESKPKRIQQFTTSRSAQEVISAIMSFAERSGYQVPVVDEPGGRLVLEEPFSALSGGFFFPVYLTCQSDGSLLVEVGIQGKIGQMGPIVTYAHNKCFKGIKTAICG
jgi:hypothetical protein